MKSKSRKKSKNTSSAKWASLKPVMVLLRKDQIGSLEHMMHVIREERKWGEQGRPPDTERIKKNTLIRVSIDLTLDVFRRVSRAGIHNEDDLLDRVFGYLSVIPHAMSRNLLADFAGVFDPVDQESNEKGSLMERTIRRGTIRRGR